MLGKRLETTIEAWITLASIATSDKLKVTFFKRRCWYKPVYSKTEFLMQYFPVDYFNKMSASTTLQLECVFAPNAFVYCVPGTSSLENRWRFCHHNWSTKIEKTRQFAYRWHWKIKSHESHHSLDWFGSLYCVHPRFSIVKLLSTGFVTGRSEQGDETSLSVKLVWTVQSPKIWFPDHHRRAKMRST